MNKNELVASESKLITFGMAYLNGDLHAGHLMLYVTADILRRLFTVLGRRARFQNAYHATGQPIRVTLDKINRGEHVPHIEVGPNPVSLSTWLKESIAKNNKTLRSLNIEANYENCFTTTEEEPIYSSFVRWQFNKLVDAGLIIRGNHSLIFCENCNVPLGDHERKTGEGVFVETKTFDFVKKDGTDYYLLLEKGSKAKVWTLTVAGREYSMKSSIEFFEKHKAALSLTPESLNFREKADVISLDLRTYIGPVVCRCGASAVVGIIQNQWFIDYENKTWKSNTMTLIHQNKDIPCTVKQDLLDRAKVLRPWPFTRTSGFGTDWFPPGSPDPLIIEPLSDSCMFMVLQPVFAMLRNIWADVENQTEVWDYVFSGSDEPRPVVEHLEEIRKTISEWGPSSYHIVGKDLLLNHVLFTLFFHAHFFRGVALPRLKVKGHVRINGSKMSKSEGNFLTLADLHPKYGINTIRLGMSMLGDSIDDCDLKDNDLKIFEKLIKTMTSAKTESKGIGLGLTCPAPLAEVYIRRLDCALIQTLKNIELVNLRQSFIQMYYEFNKILDNSPVELIGPYVEVQRILVNAYLPGIFEQEPISEQAQELIKGLNDTISGLNLRNFMSISSSAQTAKAILDCVFSITKSSNSQVVRIQFFKKTSEHFSILKDPTVLEYMSVMSGRKIRIVEGGVAPKNAPFNLKVINE